MYCKPDPSNSFIADNQCYHLNNKTAPLNFKGQIEEGKNSGLRAYLARYGRSGMGTWQKMFQASTFVIWSVVNKRNVATHFVPASTTLPLSGFLVALILATFCIQFQIPHLHWATLTVQNVSYDHFLEPWWPHHWWGITMIAALHAIHLASLLPLNAFLLLRRSLFLLSKSVAISKCPSTFKCVCASWLNHSLHFRMRARQLTESQSPLSTTRLSESQPTRSYEQACTDMPMWHVAF